MSEDIVVYQLLKVFDKPEFMDLYKELKQDEMICETCFNANQNYFLLIKYQFIQEIDKISNVWIYIFRQEVGVFGTIIDIAYDLENNRNILAEITYPLECVETIPICNYYTVYWCNPGIWSNNSPVVIIDATLDNKSFRLKGHIQKMSFKNSNRIIYRVKLTNCNCFLDNVLEKEGISLKLTIIPEKLVDNFGTLRSSQTNADKFTI